MPADRDGQFKLLFQSTPSVGRATLHARHWQVPRDNFNPRPPWGGRLSTKSVKMPQNHEISIHALRGEGDLEVSVLYSSVPRISIHALRGEGDGYKVYCQYPYQDFNPRPPWGGRHLSLLRVLPKQTISIHALRGEGDCKNIQICNAMLVHSAYKTIYFCDSCAFYLT